MERNEREEERYFKQRLTLTTPSAFPPHPPHPTHLSCKSQKVVVEVYIRHDIGEVFRVLTLLLLQLQKHLLTTQHER